MQSIARKPAAIILRLCRRLAIALAVITEVLAIDCWVRCSQDNYMRRPCWFSSATSLPCDFGAFLVLLTLLLGLFVVILVAWGVEEHLQY